MGVTLQDIADRAKVSPATVSLSLNNSQLVNEDTKKRIKELARSMGYAPNVHAQRLASRRSHTVGLIVPDIENAYYARLVRIIDQSVRERGYHLVLALSQNDLAVEKSLLEYFAWLRVEGLLIAPVNSAVDAVRYPPVLSAQQIPCLYITAYHDGGAFGAVMVDLAEGTRQLVARILATGRRQILFLCGNAQTVTTRERIWGFQRAYEEAGLVVGEGAYLHCARLDYAEACRVTRKVMARARLPDALIAINDEMALGVVQTLRQGGLQVPADVAVAGYDDTLFATVSPVPITTVRQDLEAVGKEALDRLFGALDGGPTLSDDIVMIPPLLIERGSVGPIQGQEVNPCSSVPLS